MKPHAKEENRVFGLDLMRALAIVCVVVVHAGWMSQHTGYPWINIVNGVELFFVLSGFLIGGIILRQLVEPEGAGLRAVGRFWVRRWFRTLPNYYLVLLLNVVFVAVGATTGDLSRFSWRFLFFMQNLWGGFEGFFLESWSLSVEEWFYLLFPLALTGAVALGRGRCVALRKHCYLLCAMLFLLFSLAMRLWVAPHSGLDDYWYGVRVQKVVVYHFDGIAFGLLGAYLARYMPALWHRWRHVAFVAGVAVVLAYFRVPWSYASTASIVLRISMLSFGCALLLPGFSSLHTAPRWLARPVTHVSKISYSMYLINLSLVSEVIVSHATIDDTGRAWLWYGLYWAVVLVVSTLLYRFYERPVMNLRDRF